MAGERLRPRGGDRLAAGELRRGPLLLAANHIGDFDPFVVTVALHRLGVVPRLMATGGIFDAPVVGPALERCGGIRVERGSEVARHAARVTGVALQHGGHVVAYPEGRVGTAPGGWPERGRTGLARLALELGVPVVPVSSWGAHEVLCYADDLRKLRTAVRAVLRRPVLRVHVGPPVDLVRPAGRAGRRRQPRPLPHRRGAHPRARAAPRGRPVALGRPHPPDERRGRLPRRRRPRHRPLSRHPVVDRAAPTCDAAAVSDGGSGAVGAVGAVARTATADGGAALTRERRAWYVYDFAITVFYTIVVTVFLGPYLTSVARSAADASGRIHPLGISMPPGSLFGYLVSVSVVLQVLVMPLTGAVADRTGRKRQLLTGFTLLGAVATTALFSVAGDRYLLGAGLFVLANLATGGAIVVYYSWLPDLAAARRARRGVQPRLGGGLRRQRAAAGRRPGAVHPARPRRPHRGPGGAHLPGLGRRLVGASSALVSIARLRNRPPRDAAAARAGDPPRARWPAGSGSWAPPSPTCAATRARWPSSPRSWCSTTACRPSSRVAAQYGGEQLLLSQTTLTTAILLVQVVAFFGAHGMGRIARRAGAKRTVLGGLVVWTVVVVAAYFAPARRRPGSSSPSPP